MELLEIEDMDDGAAHKSNQPQLKLRYVYDQSETRLDRLNIHNETQVSVRFSDSHRKVALNIN